MSTRAPHVPEQQESGRGLVRVLVVDAIRVTRELLASQLGQARGLDASACRPTVGELAATLNVLAPDVVLIGERPPAGLVVAAGVRESPQVPAVVAYGIADNEREAVAWAKAGSIGCLSRDADFAELLESVRRAADGESTCSPSLVPFLLRHLVARSSRASRRRPSSAGRRLTRRESEIAELAADGLTNKQIAQYLVIEVSTVKNHLHSVFSKLGIQHRFELPESLMRAAS